MKTAIIPLYDELNKAGVSFYHWDLGKRKAATIEIDGKYGVFMDFDNIDTSAKELCIVAHEGGHIATGATHKLSSPYDVIQQHENKADKWAIERLIDPDELDSAVADGHTELWDLADVFGVTEDFMQKAVCWYKYHTLAVEWCI